MGKSSKSTKSEVPANFIKIGNGGGIVGKETVYTLYDNGQIELSGKTLARLKKTDVQQMIKNLTVLGLDQIEMNNPGNVYRLIEFQVDGKTNKLVWGDYNGTETRALNLYYNNLDHIIQKAIK